MLLTLHAGSKIRIGDYLLAAGVNLARVVDNGDSGIDKKGMPFQCVKVYYFPHDSQGEFIEGHTTSICLCPPNDGHFALLPRNVKKREQALMLWKLEN